MDNKRRLSEPAFLEPVPMGRQYIPWYKDSLPFRHFSRHKGRSRDFPTTLDSRQWIFVREGLDDFRHGCPSSKDLIRRGFKDNFLPKISKRVPGPVPPKRPTAQAKQTGLFPAHLLTQQDRKSFLHFLDTCLIPHPLAHYPNLEDNLPADLLLRVLEELDPYRELEDTWQYCLGTKIKPESPRKDAVSSTSVEEPSVKPDQKTSRTWPVFEANTDFEAKTPNKKESKSEGHDSTDKFIPTGLREFCKWAASHGELGIDEDFMMDLLDISRDHKTTYSTPHVKKLFQIPPEIKYSTELSETEMMAFTAQELNWEKKRKKPKDPYKRHYDKVRYGAWYLKPRLWKKLINNEPLIDPKVILAELQKQAEEDILENLYGTIAFKDFILSKGYAMPRLLEKLFLRKGWTYDSVKTPIHKVMTMSPLFEDDKEEKEKEVGKAEVA